LILLLASLAALGLGPLAYRFAGRQHNLLAVLDGFVFVAIGGLVVLSVLPESMAQGGWPTLGFVLIGFAGPTVAEHLFHRAAKGTHQATLALGLLGLCLHALVDGAALGTTAGTQLTAAVVLHRLPVGLAIWWLLRPHFGVALPGLVLGLVAAATGAGYGIGPTLSASLSGQSVAWFQAFVAGSLLHVVFFRPHLDDHTHGEPKISKLTRKLEGVGALLAVFLLIAILAGDVEPGGAGLGGRVVGTFLKLTTESAPALVLAFFAAGLISVFMPSSSIAWMTRGGSGAQALRGMAFGLPLPICSCGVVPLYRTLIVKGVPPTAAMAFLVATPELGLDAIFISVPLLGPHMTIIRVVGAAAVALSVGWLVGSMTRPQRSDPNEADPDRTLIKASLGERVARALRVGLGDVVDDTAPWILAGLGVAALAAPFLDGAPLASIPQGVDVVVFALLGVPTYVCASAATPLVAVFLIAGLSPGAALAFLITGPATNITTFGVLSQLHGRRAAAIFSLAIIGTSVGSGFLVNGFFADIQRVSLDAFSSETTSALKLAAVVVLFGVFGASLLRRGPRGFVAELTFSGK
jgi:uncharacterized membrane protein YraQ (UPF0718 family)